MRQERCGVFETNSSSTHSICITRNRRSKMIFPQKLFIQCRDFGWEERRLDTPEDKAAYLYAAILTFYDRNDVEIAKNKIYSILGDVGVDCCFEQAKYYGKSTSWCENATIDHAYDGDLQKFVENALKSSTRLLRFLFSGDSFIITGNDNVGTDVNIYADYRHEQYYKE